MNLAIKFFVRTLGLNVFCAALLYPTAVLSLDTDRDTLPDFWERTNDRDPEKPDYIVSAGGYHTCALDDDGVKCWGRSTSGQTLVPELPFSPSQISGGNAHACALYDDGVQCWGSNEQSQIDVPDLSNPTQVSAGYDHTCALDDSGVQCWGNNSFGERVAPELFNPTQVSAGDEHTCALDDSGVQCWGLNNFGQTTVPALSNPIQVTAGISHSCAIDDKGVQCWGNNNFGEIDVPVLSNPIEVSAGSNTCALDDTGVSCWGPNYFVQTVVPALLNPVSISVGRFHVCALDQDGVQCWGFNDSGQISVPNLYIDPDKDGFSNQSGGDAFPLDPAASVDTDGDGKPDEWNSDKTAADSTTLGIVLDDDDDNDGVGDTEDAFPIDASEWVDTDSDGIGDNADPDNRTSARAYLFTNSASDNVTVLHIINSSPSPQRFSGTLYNGNGERLGLANLPLDDGVIVSQGRKLVTAHDLESIFSVSAWFGPAILEVTATAEFDLMSKLTSPSGLVSNTNCVREGSVHNIEGFDSSNKTFVRFINTGDAPLSFISGTLFNEDGQFIGRSNLVLLESLAPKQGLWLNRDDLAELVGAEWDGIASLKIDQPNPDLKLLNLNFVNEETFFNFSCFESSSSGNVYLMTNSNSLNISETHIVNTANKSVAFTGTMHSRSGQQLGVGGFSLQVGMTEPDGRIILTAKDLELMTGAEAWTGPALLSIESAGDFEAMTRLTSPSGLVSNTNCVRQGSVHNIEGADSRNLTYVRFINQGDQMITAITGRLFDLSGRQLGGSVELFTSLGPKEAVFLDRTNISEKFGHTWQGEASLVVTSDLDDDLRLLNLMLVNDETFFNFSCYEKSADAISAEG